MLHGEGKSESKSDVGRQRNSPIVQVALDGLQGQRSLKAGEERWVLRW